MTRMKASLKFLSAVVCALMVASCDDPHEQFSLVQDTLPEDLSMGISFDMPMEEGIAYSTTVVCRLDATRLYKETVDLTFEVISPSHESYKETVAFPVVSNVRQKNALGSGAQVQFKRRGGALDNQWGWRKNITCDTIPGRWRVLVSAKDEIDQNRIMALGFSYKGVYDEQE